MKLIKPTQLNEYQETKADRIIETVFIIGLSLILLMLSVLILATTSHAANNFGPEFPIYVENIDITTYQNYINNTYGGFWNLSQDNVIGWGTQENGYYVQAFAVPQVPSDVQTYLSYSPNNLSAFYPSFNYNENTLTLSFTNLANNNNKPWRIIYFYSNGVGPSYPYSATFNNSATVNLGLYGYTGKSLNYVSSTIYLTNNGAWVVNMPIFVNELIPVVNTGHATEPDFNDGDNTTSDGEATQPNTPTFPTFLPPTIDTSTLETLVKGLIDTVKEFADFVGECFSVFFSWLVSVIQNGFQSIINTIRDFAQNFYDNMVSLFEPIIEKIEYITDPIDTNVIETTIEDTNFYGVYSDFTSFNSTFDGAFNIQEPDSFTITIHVEDINLLNQQNPYILNLGSNFYPIRSALRTFLWILVTFASVFFVERNLSSWLKGSGEEK